MVRVREQYMPSGSAYVLHPVQRVRKTALTLAHAIDHKPDLLIVELGGELCDCIDVIHYARLAYFFFVFQIAALLHDVLDKKYVTPEQAADPYTFFLPFFESMAREHGIDLVRDGRARQVAQIVDNVSWSTEKRLREKGLWTQWHDNCVELHCVQDADRLDAIGAFGKSLSLHPVGRKGGRQS